MFMIDGTQLTANEYLDGCGGYTQPNAIFHVHRNLLVG
jgi:hypothetical protein